VEEKMIAEERRAIGGGRQRRLEKQKNKTRTEVRVRCLKLFATLGTNQKPRITS
jgi:hypothetical protein